MYRAGDGTAEDRDSSSRLKGAQSMEARIFGATRPLAAIAATLTLAVLSLFDDAPAVHAAGYRTANFVIDAPTPQLAKEIGDAAEEWRISLAQEWIGEALPRWAQPCPIKARVAPHLGAGGATSFVFDQGEVFDWRMNIQGSRERILDSVLPHEITHTIFATHFRQPLPRWADEGACTTVEHHSEIAKQERMLISFLKSRPGRGIPFNDMFAMREYPEDVLPLYAQGHSLSVYLIGQRGKREFMSFLADGLQDNNWRRAVNAHYGYEHLLALQNSWLDWVKAGRPALTPVGDAELLASATPTMPGATGVSANVTAGTAPVFRGQSPTAAASGTRPAAPTAAAAVPAVDASAADWTTRPVRNSAGATQDPHIRVAGGASYQ